jgi:mxaD protein
MNASETKFEPDLKVVEQLEIDRTATEVWNLIGDFGRIDDWLSVLKDSTIVAGTNNVPGAVRKLTLVNGATLEETLTAYAPEQCSMQYAITAGAFPASHYSSVLSVAPGVDASKSVITWSSVFARKDLSDTPAAGQDDAAAIAAVKGVYSAGFRDILKRVAAP